MMYLVLTTLALNISKDMLYFKVNNSLKPNLSNIMDQSEIQLTELGCCCFAPDKVDSQYVIADSVHQMAANFRKYVNDLDSTLIEITGGYKDDGVELKVPIINLLFLIICLKCRI